MLYTKFIFLKQKDVNPVVEKCHLRIKSAHLIRRGRKGRSCGACLERIHILCRDLSEELDASGGPAPCDGGGRKRKDSLRGQNRNEFILTPEEKIIGWFCILGPWYGILSIFYTRWAIIEQVPHAPPFPHSEMDGALFIKSQE